MERIRAFNLSDFGGGAGFQIDRVEAAIDHKPGFVAVLAARDDVESGLSRFGRSLPPRSVCRHSAVPGEHQLASRAVDFEQLGFSV